MKRAQIRRVCLVLFKSFYAYPSSPSSESRYHIGPESLQSARRLARAGAAPRPVCIADPLFIDKVTLFYLPRRNLLWVLFHGETVDLFMISGRERGTRARASAPAPREVARQCDVYEDQEKI
ncbi:hypothetical protein EVAR_78489_1 [Eumeta japonica]|uniref:Uncharacterized protein n=1 Tax=Eumeta variegata TaxID=151549 RepID=A0A4C1TYE6_EUMVA|nr:hypothetical protein EVAR_78489_1 [Eumeta japonica]